MWLRRITSPSCCGGPVLFLFVLCLGIGVIFIEIDLVLTGLVFLMVGLLTEGMCIVLNRTLLKTGYSEEQAIR